MGRILVEVLDQMLTVIPKSEYHLRDRLSRMKQRAFFMAPEMMHWEWRETGLILDRAFGRPHLDMPEWQRQVAEIYTGKPLGEFARSWRDDPML